VRLSFDRDGLRLVRCRHGSQRPKSATGIGWRSWITSCPGSFIEEAEVILEDHGRSVLEYLGCLGQHMTGGHSCLGAGPLSVGDDHPASGVEQEALFVVRARAASQRSVIWETVAFPSVGGRRSIDQVHFFRV
jgi:hypothetical protein